MAGEPRPPASSTSVKILSTEQEWIPIRKDISPDELAAIKPNDPEKLPLCPKDLKNLDGANWLLLDPAETNFTLRPTDQSIDLASFEHPKKKQFPKIMHSVLTRQLQKDAALQMQALDMEIAKYPGADPQKVNLVRAEFKAKMEAEMRKKASQASLKACRADNVEGGEKATVVFDKNRITENFCNPQLAASVRLARPTFVIPAAVTQKMIDILGRNDTSSYCLYEDNPEQFLWTGTSDEMKEVIKKLEANRGDFKFNGKDYAQDLIDGLQTAVKKEEEDASSQKLFTISIVSGSVIAVVGLAIQGSQGRAQLKMIREQMGDKDKVDVKKFTEDLTEKAKGGSFSRLVGMEDILEEMEETTLRPEMKHIIRSGAAGSGKSETIKEFFHRVATERVDHLKGYRLLVLEGGKLAAVGAKWAGLPDKVLQAFLEDVKKQPTIVWVKEAHQLVDVGKHSGNMDNGAIEKLKAVMEERDSTSFFIFDTDRPQKLTEDEAFARRAREIANRSMIYKEVYAVVKATADGFAEQHKLIFTDEAMKAIVLLGEYRPGAVPSCMVTILQDLIAKARKVHSSKIEEKDVLNLIARDQRTDVEKIQQLLEAKKSEIREDSVIEKVSHSNSSGETEGLERLMDSLRSTGRRAPKDRGYTTTDTLLLMNPVTAPFMLGKLGIDAAGGVKNVASVGARGTVNAAVGAVPFAIGEYFSNIATGRTNPTFNEFAKNYGSLALGGGVGRTLVDGAINRMEGRTFLNSSPFVTDGSRSFGKGVARRTLPLFAALALQEYVKNGTVNVKEMPQAIAAILTASTATHGFGKLVTKPQLVKEIAKALKLLKVMSVAGASETLGVTLAGAALASVVEFTILKVMGDLMAHYEVSKLEDAYDVATSQAFLLHARQKRGQAVTMREIIETEKALFLTRMQYEGYLRAQAVAVESEWKDKLAGLGQEEASLMARPLDGTWSRNDIKTAIDRKHSELGREFGDKLRDAEKSASIFTAEANKMERRNNLFWLTQAIRLASAGPVDPGELRSPQSPHSNPLP